MKIRILFVDDEVLLLQSLRRLFKLLHGDEWEMDFATSCTEALAMMAKSSFDVIITDMVMPGMSGVELLREVMKRYPAMVRCLFSSHITEDVFKSIGASAHHIFYKPLDMKDFKCFSERLFLALRPVT